MPLAQSPGGSLNHLQFNRRCVRTMAVSVYGPVCVHACAFFVEEVRTQRWESDSLVVEHHVRQPDVFWWQPDLHHSIKLLWDPCQTIVLPLLRVNKNKILSHSSEQQQQHTSWEERRGGGGGGVSVGHSVVNMTHQHTAWVWGSSNFLSFHAYVMCLTES